MRYKQVDTQQGSIPVFIAILTVTLITSAAVILSSVLAIQIRTTEDIIASERAYYAATSGLEEALYTMILASEEGNEPEGEVLQSVEIVDGEVPYENSSAQYDTRGQLILVDGPNGASGVPCINSEGEYEGLHRRIRLDQVAVDCGV